MLNKVTRKSKQSASGRRLDSVSGKKSRVASLAPIFIFLFVICSLFTLFLTGCASSYQVTKNGDGVDKMSYKEFNQEIKNKNVTLSFTKGPESDGMNIRVDTNFAKWQDLELQETRSVQIGLLKTVVRQNRFFGGLKGFGLGLLPGAGLGYLIKSDSPAVELLAGTVFGGLIGGIAGAIIGAITGHKFNYRFY